MSAAFKEPAVHNLHGAHEEAGREGLPAVRIPFPVAVLGVSALPFLACRWTLFAEVGTDAEVYEAAEK
jgi:hypothetical protein